MWSNSIKELQNYKFETKSGKAETTTQKLVCMHFIPESQLHFHKHLTSAAKSGSFFTPCGTGVNSLTDRGDTLEGQDRLVRGEAPEVVLDEGGTARPQLHVDHRRRSLNWSCGRHGLEKGETVGDRFLMRARTQQFIATVHRRRCW